MGGVCGTYGGTKGAYSVLIKKIRRIELFGRLRRVILKVIFKK
jgi:hypothetical protein